MGDRIYDLGDRNYDLGDCFYGRPGRKTAFWARKKGPVEGPSPFLSKDNTLTSEMQIALFSPLPPKASSGEDEFSIGLPEDAAG